MGRKWLWAVSFMLLFCISCKDNRKQVRKDLEELPSQPIELCIEHMQVWKDGWNTDPPHGHKGLKLIIYSDSTVCSSCRLRNIHLWDDWVIKTEAYRDILDICFIFSPTLKDINNFRLAMRTYAPDYPVYVDSLSIFRKANPHLPTPPVPHLPSGRGQPRGAGRQPAGERKDRGAVLEDREGKVRRETLTLPSLAKADEAVSCERAEKER